MRVAPELIGDLPSPIFSPQCIDFDGYFLPPLPTLPMLPTIPVPFSGDMLQGFNAERQGFNAERHMDAYNRALDTLLKIGQLQARLAEEPSIIKEGSARVNKTRGGKRPRTKAFTDNQ